MGNSDVAYQLRNQYGFDHWLWKCKWWWPILIWVVQIVMANAYICYTLNMDIYGVENKATITHYNFQKHIELAWIKPEK